MTNVTPAALPVAIEVSGVRLTAQIEAIDQLRVGLIELQQRVHKLESRVAWLEQRVPKSSPDPYKA